MQNQEAERAKRAVQRFRAMLPGLNGYVRAISGRKDLTIVLASGQPRTDGKKIYFEPPIELGDDLIHERRLCDRRDPESYAQLCKSCAVRETLLIKLYHELAHNIYGTFEMKASPIQLKQKIYREVEKLEPKYSAQIQEKLWHLNPPPISYQDLARHVNPFLPILVNCLEDLRVDEAMFQARKGTRSMFYAMTREFFVNGIPSLDGSVSYWKDMPLNSQALVGIFVAGSKYKFNDWFHPKVEEALRDKIIQELVQDVDQMNSSLETFERAFPILQRLRELGFCLTEEEYDQKEQEDEANDSEQSSSAGSTGDSEHSDDSSSEPNSETESDSGESEGTSEGDEGSSQDGGNVASDSAEQPQEAPEEIQSGSGSNAPDSEVADDGEESDPGSDDSSSGNGDELGDEDESVSDSPSRDGSQEGSEGSPREPGEPGNASEADPAVEELIDEESSSDREDREGDGEGDDVLDTGADEGFGGVPLKEVYGTAEQAVDDLEVITKHGDHAESVSAGQNVSDRTIVQSIYFETESRAVWSVKEHFVGDNCPADAWTRFAHSPETTRRRRGIDLENAKVEESVLGPALLHMRRVFADNARARVEPHLKSGRVNARVLGKRAPFHDTRLFQKKRLPGKRSYAVLLGVDISGSTVGVNIKLAKQAAYAQAELCNRLGIDFAVYAPTASGSVDGAAYELDMYCIKDFNSPWDSKAEEALLNISSMQENLDGHSLEYYRKKIESHPATDKIILYYSDGRMPAANYDEELEILQREIETCRRKNITLLGVGIRTDSPKRHGLDTVEVLEASDVGKVIQHLESRILHNR